MNVLGVNRYINDVSLVLEDQVIDGETSMRYLNLLKMLTYTLCQTMENFENEECKPSIDTVPTASKVSQLFRSLVLLHVEEGYTGTFLG